MNVTKKTMLLARTPIAQTPDGQVKVMTATDGGQSATFTWGHEWKIGGVNMFDTPHAGVDWTLSEVALYDAGSTGIVMYGAYSEDGTEITVRKAGGMSDPEPGTYNATIGIMATKTGETQPIGLDIPITLVVEE